MVITNPLECRNMHSGTKRSMVCAECSVRPAFPHILYYSTMLLFVPECIEHNNIITTLEWIPTLIITQVTTVQDSTTSVSLLDACYIVSRFESLE